MIISLKKILITVHILVAVILGIYGYMGSLSSRVFFDDIKGYSSAYTVCTDEGFQAVPQMYHGEGYMDFMYGPYIKLPGGTYHAVIEYEADDDQRILAYSTGWEDAFIKGGQGYLRKTNHTAEYLFETQTGIEKFELKIQYNGSGNLSVKSVTIASDMRGHVRNILNVLLLLLLADAVILLRRKGRLGRFLALTGLAVASSLPLMVYGINYGHDFNFHLDRIEGIVSSLRCGQFPVRIENFWMGGYGYPTSVFYGSTLLYVAALFRLCGYPLVMAYKVYVLVVNLVTAYVCGWCFERIFRDRRVTYVLTFAYLCATYRMVDIYTRAAVGEYTAMIFLPILALALYRIYCFEKTGCTADIIKNAILLCAGMSGILQSHMLTVEMVSQLMLIVFLVLLTKSIRKGALLSYGAGGLMTLLLNLWFIIPFLDYYGNVPVSITDGIKNETIKTIQGDGAYIGQFFAFGQGIFGLSYVNVNERMNYSPGAFLMLPLVIISLYLIVGRLSDAGRLSAAGGGEDCGSPEDGAKKRMAFHVCFSVLCLFMASDIFPWNAIALWGKAGIMMTQVQFPWRYITLAIIFLTLLLGEGLVFIAGALKGRDHLPGSIAKEMPGGKRVYDLILVSLVTVTVFSLTGFLSSYFDGIGVAEYYSESNIDDSRLIGGEYMRVGSTMEGLKEELYTAGVEAVIKGREKGVIRVGAKSESGGELGFPVFNYKGYTVTSGEGKSYDIYDGPNNIVTVKLEAGFDGELTLEFKEPFAWRAGEVLSLIALALIAALCVLVKKRPSLQVILS